MRASCFALIVSWVLACIKRLYQLLPFTNKSFVVLSSARSGSGLLVQLLNSHHSISCKGELLNRELLVQYQLNSNTSPETYVNYILSKLLPLKPWYPYTGFKLFNEQIEYCHLSMEKLLVSLNFPPVIILYRESLLDTYVSFRIAQQNNIWYSEDTVNHCSIHVDWESLKEYCEQERRLWKKNLAVLKRKRCIFVCFNDLTENQFQTMNKIFTFLKVETDQPLHVISKRQNPLPLEKKVTNYKEIMDKAECEGYMLKLECHWFKTQ